MVKKNEREIIEEAVEWMIALQEAPADPERESAFLDWLTASEENARAWQEIQQTRNTVRAVGRSVLTDGTPEIPFRPEPAPVPDPSSTSTRTWKAIGMAAMALAACLILFVAGPRIYVQLVADHVTGAGEVRKIRLDDGSLVHLGADSAIAVDYQGGLRKVTLLSGESYFDVRKDPQRPFKVSFGRAETTVLGTRFEISLSSSGAAVAVERGAVLVSYPSSNGKKGERQSELSKGKGLRLNWDGPSETSTVLPESVASWRQGKLIVENWPVSEVIAELKRHYRGKLLVARDSAGWNDRISGVYDLKNPVEAIKLVAATHGVPVYQASPWLLIIPSL